MKLPRAVMLEEGENFGSNPSATPAIGEIVAARLARRDVVRGALAVAALAPFSSRLASGAEPQDARSSAEVPGPAAAQTPASGARKGSFSFPELGVTTDERHHVAAGYEADVLIRWGDPVAADAPAFDPYGQTPGAQAIQFGYNNDFLGFLPIDGRSDRGLLVVNHEYVNEELMFPGRGWLGLRHLIFGITSKDQVDIELMAHGGSVIEIERVNGKWSVVGGSKYARRITGETEMRLSGPAAGHRLMKTPEDMSGTRVRGMLNNCAGGITPWGTWLTCEENFNYYFAGSTKRLDPADAAALKRYGVPVNRYSWANFHARFDVTKAPNEANRFGWVVEIDPFDPSFMPVKRTALGRFKHEGAGNVVNADGRFVVYQGDDERFEYIYRFVTDGKVDVSNPAANKDLLDSGVLYVARFHADGTGEWLALVHGQGPLTAENGFENQGDVVIRARLAADKLGATRMDRPEDIEVSPRNGKVLVMLTKNEKRTSTGERAAEPANPRPGNRFGHIIELMPDGGDHAATGFRWEILLKCGDPAIAEVGATFNPATSEDGWFANPDNCVFDAEGRLWIATDGNSAGKTGRSDGLWALETEGELRGAGRCFFQAPRGAELCGPCMTSDMETFFLAVQHPGERGEDDITELLSTFESPSTRWPDFKDDVPPRPSIVAITRKGGGKIGV